MDKFILYKENIDVLDNFIYSVGGGLFTLIIGRTFYTYPSNFNTCYHPIWFKRSVQN